MSAPTDQLALDLARWSWYARDALAAADHGHARRTEEVRQLEARTNAALLAAQQAHARIDDVGQQLAATFAAVVSAGRRARERRDSLVASLARADASVEHWTTQRAAAELARDAATAWRDACARAVTEAGDARGALADASARHADVEVAVRQAQEAVTSAATVLQQARAVASDDSGSSASLALVACRLLSDALGHLDVARLVHDETQQLASAARRALAEAAELPAADVRDDECAA